MGIWEQRMKLKSNKANPMSNHPPTTTTSRPTKRISENLHPSPANDPDAPSAKQPACHVGASTLRGSPFPSIINSSSKATLKSLPTSKSSTTHQQPTKTTQSTSATTTTATKPHISNPYDLNFDAQNVLLSTGPLPWLRT